MLAKAKATSLRGKVKRFGDYNGIAPRFAVVSQELRALHAAVNGDVAAIAELKSTWDDLDVKGKQLTAVCASYKSLLASAARNFEYLQRKAKQKSLPEQSHYKQILS